MMLLLSIYTLKEHIDKKRNDFRFIYTILKMHVTARLLLQGNWIKIQKNVTVFIA